MDEEKQDWQQLLKRIIRDINEQRRIALAMAVNPATLKRWGNGTSLPRQENVLRLVDVVPQHYQDEMRTLLKRAFPQYFPAEGQDDGPNEAPANFYVNLLYAYANSLLNMRKDAVSTTIFQQVLSLLDPRNLGLAVTIDQCVTPSVHNMVRSLRRTMGRGNHPWPTHLEQQILFLGAETPAGHCANTRRPIVIQNPEEQKEQFPLYKEVLAKSEYACPIMLGDTLAGVLHLASIQPYFFTEKRQELARFYATAATLAFTAKEFYTSLQVGIGIMPSYERQRPVLSTFPERSRRIHIEASDNRSGINFEEARDRAWQEIEQVLTSLPPEDIQGF